MTSGSCSIPPEGGTTNFFLFPASDSAGTHPRPTGQRARRARRKPWLYNETRCHSDRCVLTFDNRVGLRIHQATVRYEVHSAPKCHVRPDAMPNVTFVTIFEKSGLAKNQSVGVALAHVGSQRCRLELATLPDGLGRFVNILQAV